MNTDEHETIGAEEPESDQPRRVRYEGLPLVVIAGRPNVGKSTLYNRLLHKRKAITDPTPGVTRDPVDAECVLRDSGKRIRLVDTGGFKLDRVGLDDLVVAKSLGSLEGADLIIFLVDASEMNPEDEEFAALLRKWSPKVLLVVNKADSPERDPLVWGHLRWGFEPMLFISAEHGRNIDDLEAAMVARLDFSKVVAVDLDRAPIRLAILGKPNTGKSTLLNSILGEDKSIVSPIAGTTRDVVEGRFTFKKREFVILDTAGIRRKAKVTEAVEYYSVNRAIRCVADCDVVIHLIDAAEGLTDQDKKIAAFAAAEGRGIIFVLNKWDLMPDLKNSFEAARDKLRYFFGQLAFAPVLPLSGKKGTGVEKLLNTAISVYAQLTKEIETSRLNKAVESWIATTPPPVGPKTKWKLRYAVQTKVNPQQFGFFVTKPDAVADSYVSFLRNKIRSDLGLELVPVILELKASRQGWTERADDRRAAAEGRPGSGAAGRRSRAAVKASEPSASGAEGKRLSRGKASDESAAAKSGVAPKRSQAGKKATAAAKAESSRSRKPKPINSETGGGRAKAKPKQKSPPGYRSLTDTKGGTKKAGGTKRTVGAKAQGGVKKSTNAKKSVVAKRSAEAKRPASTKKPSGAKRSGGAGRKAT